MRSEWYGTLRIRLTPFLTFCRGERKRMALLGMACCLLCGVAVGHGIAARQAYVIDADGALRGLRLTGDASTVSLSLQVEAERDGETAKEQVTLALRRAQAGDTSDDNASGDAAADGAANDGETLTAQLQDLLWELGDAAGERLTLPRTLEDGTRLRWTRPRDLTPLWMPLFFPLGMVFAYRGQQEKERKARRAEKDQIRRGLPALYDQLLLLLGSGLILQDAFGRIADGYRRHGRTDALGQLLLRVSHDCQESGMSLLPVLEAQARAAGVREFTRMVNLVADHQKKGVSLGEKLEAERALLWEQRKKLAEEQGRLAETRLSFPLAMLLVVLILVTAAPALLEM